MLNLHHNKNINILNKILKIYNMKIVFYIFAFITLFSCNKTKFIEVEKKSSWKEVTRFTGNDRIFLNSGRSADALYFQQPFGLAEVKGTTNDKIKAYSISGLGTDIYLKMAITADFTVVPFRNNTCLNILNNKEPVLSGAGTFIDLKSIDPTLTSITTRYYSSKSVSSCVNKNNTVMVSYDNNRIGEPYTLILVGIKVVNQPTYKFDTLFTKKVTISRLTTDVSSINSIFAVDDYFLVDFDRDGVYKIKEDGTFRKVVENAYVGTIYTYNSEIYMHGGINKVFISSDNSETWQQYSGGSELFRISQFNSIKDSLVGASRSSIYTLKWNGINYTQRFLKNDGFETADINGIEILKDTVYVATTSGLYAKPVSTFFETKK